MSSTRQNKVARLIQKDLSIIFMEMSREKFQGKMVTVTVVRVTPDFSYANVYLSIFPSKDIEEIMQLIQDESKTIRYKVAQKVRNQLRQMPELKFYIDDSLEYAKKIDKLLDN